MKKFFKVMLIILLGGLFGLKSIPAKFFSNNFLVEGIVYNLEVKNDDFNDITVSKTPPIEEVFQDSGLPEWIEGPF